MFVHWVLRSGPGESRGHCLHTRGPDYLSRMATPPLRVLIVEDDPTTTEMATSLVTGWGHTAVVAADGATALKTAAVFKPHVVLLDLNLPDQHGYEVAKQLRRAAPGAKALIIAVTGWGQAADQQASEAAGIAHHLVKPLKADVLERILADYHAE